ncbi:nitroreductase family protein [Chloroflexota bacterium]
MQIEEFLELARKRRSIRVFKADPVPGEYIEKLLEAGRWAMSGANGQPWEFIVIKHQATRKKLAEIFRRYSELTTAVELTRSQGYRHTDSQLESASQTLWSNAPVIIAVLGDRRAMQASTLAFRLFEYHTFDQNMANATHMIHLAAAALGLGAQWISIPEPAAEEMKPILGIPAVITLPIFIPIGYPAIEPASYRRELSELVHYEKYDMSKFRSNSDIREFVKRLRQRHEE